MSSDELQQKLNQAKAQQKKVSDCPSDPRALAERKKYHALYNRIYPMLVKSSFDFAEVADVAGVKERRMREALLSRLALDDMVKLMGYKPGSCYVCGSRIRGCYTQEPFCLMCLRSIDVAVQTLYPIEPTLKLAIARQKMKVPPAPSILDDLLACGVPLMAITGDPMHVCPEVLSILERADDETDAPDELDAILKLERPSWPNSTLKVDLRRFGFQRVKPRD